MRFFKIISVLCLFMFPLLIILLLMIPVVQAAPPMCKAFGVGPPLVLPLWPG